MAQTHLTQEELKALETTRKGLFALSNNIASLKQDILRSTPLPKWTSLQTSAAILANNIQGLTALMARHAELYNKTVIYPSTNYPGRTQEGVLNSLLRKKLEPPIATWVEEGRDIAANTKSSPASERDEEQFADWVRGFLDQRIHRYATDEAGDNYTAEEREMGIENVRTGLKRTFDEDESDEEDEEDQMKDAGDAVTTVSKTATGVEFGLGEIKKHPTGKARAGGDLWAFTTGGMVAPPATVRR